MKRTYSIPTPHNATFPQFLRQPEMAGDLAELTDKLGSILMKGYLSSSQISSLIHYIIQAGDTINAETFIRALVWRVPQHEEAAQQLEQNGVKKGLAQLCH